MTKLLTLWSLRTSVVRGNHYVAERQTTEENAQEWLAMFRSIEPGVEFIVSKRKPSTRLEA